LNNLGIDGLITFLYYKDLKKVQDFYEKIIGLNLTIDQGNVKIYRLANNAHIGLVDERYGFLSASSDKPVMITILVQDVDAWYEHFIENGIKTLNAPYDRKTHRGFMLEDPEGYVIEIQKFF
jgi:predicted enzyme related to lactoylglutathione lyase